MIELIRDFWVNYEQALKDYQELESKLFPSGDWDDEVIERGTGIHLRGDNFLDDFLTHGMKPTRELQEKMIERYSFWNPESPKYTVDIIEALSQTLNVKITRARYLRLGPGMGLPVHQDMGVRYHLPILTNEQAIIGNVSDVNTFENPKIQHLSTSNHFYKIDTRQPHFVFNAGKTPRIHLVIS